MLLVFALLASSVGAGERLKVVVSHTFRRAPADLLIQAIVERDDANRALEVVAESSEFFRASTVQLDGSRAPRLNTIGFSGLPSGSYEVAVRVLAANGHEVACVTDWLMVY
jgi:hypothetical protein